MICEQVREALAELLPTETAEPVTAEETATAPAPESEEETSAAAGDEAAVAPAPLQVTDYPSKGFHLDITVASDQVQAAAEILDRAGFFLEAITGVDWLADRQMEVVYDYNNVKELCRVVVRARIAREQPELPTISRIYPGADWHERETHDFFGIVFTGHPHLVPLLLPEDADFHPLRKDYKP